MNAEGARQGAHRRQHDLRPREYQGAATERDGWTPADAAELDVLVFELARGYDEHRKRCPACLPGDCPEYVAWREHLDLCPGCRGDAPLTYGPPCPRRREMIEHGNSCPSCNPCPALRKAIEAVLEWREARGLRSRAEWLRAELERLEEIA